MGWTTSGDFPVSLLPENVSSRSLQLLECVWQLSQFGPCRVVLPDILLSPARQLVHQSGHRHLNCIAFDALNLSPESGFDIIVMLGESIQSIPADIARRVLDHWRVIRVVEPMIVFANPQSQFLAQWAPLPLGNTPKALVDMRHVLGELENLAARDMIMPARFGAKLRCRYNFFDIEAVRAVDRDYFKYINVRPQDVIVDVGAHLGSFAVPCGIQSSPSAGGKVIAYEPSPDNFRLLSENIHRNCPGNVKALPIAIYKHRCRLPLLSDAVHSTGHGLYGGTPSSDSSMVECVGLADVIAEAGGSIDILKVDAEGAEYDFFFGHSDLLRKHVRTIMAEAHLHGNQSGEHLLKFLEDAGFKTKFDGPHHALNVYAER